MEEKVFANAFNLIPQLGPIKLAKIKAYFGSFANAWQNHKPSEYKKAGLEDKLTEIITQQKLQIDPTKAYEEMLKNGIEAVLLDDPLYPTLLKEISSPPPILYFRGNLKVLQKPCVAVVGTRKVTTYGVHATQEIVSGLVQSGITIVSGLAFGVDGQALKTCVTNGGSGVAVLATPIDDLSISPRSNYQLAQQVLSNGCLISEYPLGISVQKQNFPIRNRLISGLCSATLVIEADEESGSLITANYALEQNREVFAVPGSIFSQVSRGTNNLLKLGAQLATSALDILTQLNLSAPSTEDLEPNLDSSENDLLQNLTRQPVHIDDLVRNIKMPVAKVNSMLTVLEMKGWVKNLGGARYVRTR